MFRTILLTAGFCGIFFSALSQEVRPRVSGLETDSVYMSLLQKEARLKTQEDSLLRVIRDSRALIARDTTNIYNRSQQILRMEEQVFAIRNQLGSAASKINGIEQEFILNNLSNPDMPSATSGRQPTSDRPNLIDNDYFQKNLTADEYRQLRESHRLKAEWYGTAVAEYKTRYAQLAELAAGYDSVMTQTEANALYELYRSQVSRLKEQEKQIAEAWEGHYNQEIYLYSYLLDKLNRMDELAALNEKGRTRDTYSAQEVMSVALAELPGQYDLSMEYELALAQALNLKAAADSLNRVRNEWRSVELAFPKIELQEKEFVQYQSVSFPATSPYNAENPIPELWIPEAGTYYSVTVGIFSQRQAVSIFKGAVPVAYQRVGSQWRYFVGLYRSYGDAVDAVQELKEAGFRRPEAVRWQDGKYENLAPLAVKNAGFWRIAIQAAEGELPEDVRFALNRYARSKEVTRVGGVFYVGTFTDKLQVDEVMQALARVQGITPSVEEIEE